MNNIHGKVDRGEKYEISDIDQVEATTADLNTRTEATLVETASARANPESSVGKSRDVKKKKKFLGIFGGSGNDEYDELIGNVTPGRDRELFVVAAREVPCVHAGDDDRGPSISSRPGSRPPDLAESGP